jgi:hypothetical protein
MRIKYTSMRPLWFKDQDQDNSHTAILLTGMWVTVDNPDFWAHGMRGFIVRIERSIEYAFIQLDSRGQFAQVCVPLSNIKPEEN